MSATSETSGPSTSRDSSRYICSVESLVGHSPFAAQLFPMIEKFGLVPLLASLSPRRAKEAGLLTSGTCGPTGTTSSRSAALQQSLESRLRPLLTGSDLCEVIWKPWTTPWGQSLWKPRARVRTTFATDIGSWPTPKVTDARQASQQYTPERGMGLSPMVLQTMASPWATPTSRDHKDGPPCLNVPVNGLLGRQVWPTPTSSSHATEDYNEAGNSAGLVAIRKHALATWGTPSAQEPGGTAEMALERKRRSIANGSSMGVSVTHLSHQIQSSNGSSAPTEKPGALNPEFVCWLMGYPPEWLSCAPSATPSTRAQRPPSSRQP